MYQFVFGMLFLDADDTVQRLSTKDALIVQADEFQLFIFSVEGDNIL
jgi:hypothetical protein